MTNFLSRFPETEQLERLMKGTAMPAYREVNCHIHTPYSFSAFEHIGDIFELAGSEQVKLLGINDFFVTDGYDEFNAHCMQHKVFPLFNIEFIGLMKEEQQLGTRINDPNNPGRIYFTGKALDYPHHLGGESRDKLENAKQESQEQIRVMLVRLNEMLRSIDPSLCLGFEEVKQKFAQQLVRERHIAKALRHLAMERFPGEDERLIFLRKLYGGREPGKGWRTPALLENELRSNLLKAGGAAFVEENEQSFPTLEALISIIIEAGGVPCYPVLLDDNAGKFTEFEMDMEQLYQSLQKQGIGCLELIPLRNDLGILRSFVDFFDRKGFIITFGTEHNTPEMIPLTPAARHSIPLDSRMKEIAWKGTCMLAAHQYFRAQGLPGIPFPAVETDRDMHLKFAKTGQLIIEYFLNKYSYEA